MSASAVTLTGGSSEEILAADQNRDFYTLQLHTLFPVYLAFGEDASDASGLRLTNIGDSVRVKGSKARLACNGYAASTPTIGIETFEDVEYTPGPLYDVG